MTGIELIQKERQEQIEKHGFTPDHDVMHYQRPALLCAAEGIIAGEGRGNFGEFPKIWSDNLCHKILAKPLIERLAIAGALIAAEIDRQLLLESKNEIK